MASYTGYTCETGQSLLLDAGAFFKNYNILTDTYESAMTAGKCLGATKGGGAFAAAPEVRNIEIDGMRGYSRGSVTYDSWNVTMTANLVEIKPATLKDALGTGVISNDGKFYKIRARSYIQDSDYIDNITWVGRLSGSNDPVVIQIFNAMNTTGINMTMADKSEGVLAVTFQATNDTCNNPQDADYAPFAIYYPISVPVPTIAKITDASTSITGTGVDGATVYATGGTIPADTTGTVTGGSYSIIIPAQTAGTEIIVYQVLDTRQSLPVKVTVEMAQIEGFIAKATRTTTEAK